MEKKDIIREMRKALRKIQMVGEMLTAFKETAEELDGKIETNHLPLFCEVAEEYQECVDETITAILDALEDDD